MLKLSDWPVYYAHTDRRTIHEKNDHLAEKMNNIQHNMIKLTTINWSHIWCHSAVRIPTEFL